MTSYQELKLLLRVSYEQLRQVRLNQGAPWFTGPWNLNLLVFRSQVVGLWDDAVALACESDDPAHTVVQWVTATGDASEQEFLTPTHPDGCIWTLPQHVPGGLVLGDFRDRPSLLQASPFRYVRWAEGTVPTVAQLLERAREHEFRGIRGTHVHPRSSTWTPSQPAAYDSMGCTVLKYPHEWDAALRLIRMQVEHHHTNVCSPTYVGWDALEDL